ncbi:hypothetical protein XELAEV_18016584mg [Xenopus laevis]|uniref:Uncharacterized protein n=1 Tax=Xenopus laevis TaxID=8355 RepID=A0A974DAV0_XENLA|nr:hypothetical protein XELAEV_18016584mg [Xenopus laevis]
MSRNDGEIGIGAIEACGATLSRNDGDIGMGLWDMSISWQIQEASPKGYICGVQATQSMFSLVTWDEVLNGEFCTQKRLISITEKVTESASSVPRNRLCAIYFP